MNEGTEDVQIAGLPERYVAGRPQAEDAAEVAALLAEQEHVGRGYATTSAEGVLDTLIGYGSWTRRQALIRRRDDGALMAWLSVHDRAAGRTLVDCVLRRSLPPEEAAELAGELFAAADRSAAELASFRDLPGTLLDSGAYETDRRQQEFLKAAGYEHVRTWLQMSRPVTATEESSLPGPREGVTIRRVEKHEDGLPVAADLQAVHRVLEESFADHFSSYRESFPEFVMRLRESPGHRWDHWWLAELDDGGETLTAGALVSSELGPDLSGREGSYIDYIGVHRTARGRGVAKALLNTVVADAAQRGRGRVGLEVDADSPTGADGLYASLGWVTKYRTQSWHCSLETDRISR